MIQSLHKTLLSAALVAAALFPLRAADGRIPIAAAPYTISAPGSYYLSGNISAAAGDAIYINASNVELDLGGLTITHTGVAPGDYGIRMAANARNIRVHHGTIIGGYSSIYHATGLVATELSLDHLNLLNFSSSAIQTGAFSASFSFLFRIEDNFIKTQSTTCFAGIYLSFGIGGSLSRNVVQGCVGGASPGNGITSNGPVNNMRIEDNSVSGCSGPAGYGMLLGSVNRSYIRGNHAANNSGYGLYIGGTENVYSSNATPGNTAGARLIGPGNTDGGGNFP